MNWTAIYMISMGLNPFLLFLLAWIIKKQSTRTKEIEVMKAQLLTLQTQITPFWNTLQNTLSDALHKPHPESRELDILLEKLELGTLAPEERAELPILLHQIIDNPNKTKDERGKAAALLLVLPLAYGELSKIATAKEMREKVVVGLKKSLLGDLSIVKDIKAGANWAP